jgi:hypothetical protein
MYYHPHPSPHVSYTHSLNHMYTYSYSCFHVHLVLPVYLKMSLHTFSTQAHCIGTYMCALHASFQHECAFSSFHMNLVVQVSTYTIPRTDANKMMRARFKTNADHALHVCMLYTHDGDSKQRAHVCRLIMSFLRPCFVP